MASNHRVSPKPVHTLEKLVRGARTVALKTISSGASTHSTKPTLLLLGITVRKIRLSKAHLICRLLCCVALCCPFPQPSPWDTSLVLPPGIRATLSTLNPICAFPKDTSLALLPEIHATVQTLTPPVLPPGICAAVQTPNPTCASPRATWNCPSPTPHLCFPHKYST